MSSTPADAVVTVDYREQQWLDPRVRTGDCCDGIDGLGGQRFDMLDRTAAGVMADGATVGEQRQRQVQLGR